MYKILIPAFCFLNFTAIAQVQITEKPDVKHVGSYTVEGMKEDAEDPANSLPAPVEDTNAVYYYTEPMPEFPGDLDKYIKKELVAPKDKIAGKVMVKFLIMRDGTVAEPKIKKSLSEDCDKEALRLVQHMPKWKPGLKNGKPVIVSYSLYVPFE